MAQSNTSSRNREMIIRILGEVLTTSQERDPMKKETSGWFEGQFSVVDIV